MKNFFHFSCQLLIATLLLFSCATGTLHAQSNNNMGVGTTTPDASAILDVYSNTKGLLIPRPSTAPASPATGLMYYSTGEKLFKYWDGAWRPIGLWSLNGSAARYTAGNVETTGNFFMNNTAPTIYLQDTDHKSGMIHQNANLMHFLSGAGNNSTTWQINGSHWPLTLNMNNDEATFGGSAYFMEGNVGIGTTTPGYKLTIAGGTDGIGLDNTTSMYAKNASGTYEVFCHPRWSDNIMYMNYGAGGFNIRNNAGAATMFMTNGGNVGIGTTSPGQKLDVVGNITASGSLNSGAGFNVTGHSTLAGRLNITDAALTAHAAGSFFNSAAHIYGFGPVGAQTELASIYAVNSIISGNAFMAVSDRRIKKDFRLSIGGNDLASLRKLRVTDYRHIDEITKGKAFKKGFIAQEVEAVFPEAIQIMSDFIPNVYELASKTVLADGLLLISLDKKHDFAAGDEVKLIFPDGEKLPTVEATPSETAFSIKWTAAAPENAFVFGKKVADFHTVDYDRIFTLNVSATQELATQVEQLKKELSVARAENAALRQEMDERLAKLENIATGSAQK